MQRWLSGLRRTIGNRVTANTRPEVQILFSAPSYGRLCLPFFVAKKTYMSVLNPLTLLKSSFKKAGIINSRFLYLTINSNLPQKNYNKKQANSVNEKS